VPLRTTEAATATWRRLIGSFLLIALCVTSYFAIRWIWRDITYWSRSATVPYRTDTLEQCVRLAEIPAQEGVIVKDTPTPGVARIVVYGHSDAVSHLGPSAEEPVNELLGQLRSRISSRCGSPEDRDPP
jgi:hypothetical protein